MSTLLNDGYCKVCKIKFGKNVKNMESHLKGKKHFRSLPTTVTISGLSPNTSVEEVNNYFSKFGKITTFTHNEINNSITYSFENNETMTQVLHCNHKIDGKTLELTWQTPVQISPAPSLIEVSTKPSPSPTLPPKNNNTMLTPVVNHGDIIESLRTVSNFDDKIKLLRDKLRYNHKDITERCNQITNDIQEAIRRNFPVCEIYLFGSTITQLDYLGSDLDIFIDKVKSTSTEVQCLSQIKSKLYASRKFNEIILIRTAKVPIIKCKHISTKTNCDINIKNMLPVYNSQLIYYYLTTDDRLHQLMIFIKYLFHLHDLKKNGYFSSYALAWLFIFYLQQPPFCLPSVKELEIYNVKKLEDGWNCMFQQLENFQNISKLKRIRLFGIFKGFLMFYTNFDYTTKVICPYLGKALNRTDFFNHETLPDSFSLYKNNINKGEPPLHINSAIVIQDPFEHNRNITAVTAPHCLGRFVVTCDVFLKEYLKSENDSIITLLTRQIIKVQEFNVNFSFNYPQNCDDFKQFKSEFKTKVHTILKNVLQFEITELNTFPQYSGVVGEQFEKIVGFKCRGNTNVWQDRMTTLKNLKQKTPVIKTTALDEDIEITAQLIKNFSPALNIGLAMRFIYNKQLSKMHCFIHSESNCKLFSYTVVFFKNRIIPWLLNQETQQEPIEFKEDFKQEIDVSVKTEMTPVSVTDHQSQPTNDLEEQEDSKNNVQVNSATDELEDIGDSNNKYGLEVVDTVEQEEEEGEDVEVEEEDVPDDFFDAFSNADFMEGLDIVDAWDENAVVQSNNEDIDDKKDDDKKEESPKKQEDVHKMKRSSSKHSSRDRSRHSKEHLKRSRDRTRDDDCKRRRLYSDEHRYRSRSRDRDRYRLSRDQLRRDPEKTRRDICKDKIKCARDQEMKIVSDKLKLVETGLVPPGTEMDVDFTEMESLKRQQHQQHARSHDKEDDSFEKHRSTSSKRYNTSRDRHRSTSRDYIRKRRSRSGSIVRKWRGDSRHSDLSDREIWLREQRRTSRKRSRSESPATVTARKQDIAKRRTFLEEIREKLNEVNCPVPTIPVYQSQQQQQQQQQQQMYPPQPVPAPVPAPIPPPQLQQPQHYYQNQQYDQSYFIGYNGDFTNSGVPNMNLNVAQPTIVSVPITPANPISYPTVSKPKRSNLTTVPTVSTNQKIIQTESEKTKMETSNVTKLFADKKISLSDFLTMTAKSEVQSSTPEHLQKKIKVISRCQDALRALSDEPNFVGRLRVKPTKQQIIENEGKYKSPLRKIPIVRFRFTTRTSSPSTKENADSFANLLDNVLQKIGVIRETVDLEETTTTTNLTTNTIEDTSILAVKASRLLVKKKENVIEKQTCEECEKRKKLIFSDVGTQCVDNKTTTTIGIQVNEDDLQPTKALAKNSIAFLTPAQLLQKTKEKEGVDKRTPPSSPNKAKQIIPPSEFLRNFRQNPDVGNSNNNNNNWTRFSNPGHPDLNRHPTPYYQNIYNEQMPPPQNYNYDDYYRSRYGPSRY